MAVNASIKIIKAMPFKGGTRQWSNRYHFNGGTPPDSAHWYTLMDAVTAAEKALFDSGVSIVEAVGYAAGSDVPVASKTYSLAGTFSPGANDRPTPGEVAALVRWSTSARSTKNHPIYCFKYYHRAYFDSTVGIDKVAADQKTKYNTYANNWLTGFSDGGSVTAVIATPAGHAGTAYVTEEYLTHRDFPYTTSL